MVAGTAPQVIVIPHHHLPRPKITKTVKRRLCVAWKRINGKVTEKVCR